jgi:phosphoribosylformylglycinamidine cyclo-ligase
LKNGHIDGLAHITGGGLTENIVRVLPADLGLVLDPKAWPRPAVFDWLQENGNIEENEMLRTFNCGIGMVMLVSKSNARAAADAAKAAGLACHDIGEVISMDGEPRVEYWSR